MVKSLHKGSFFMRVRGVCGASGSKNHKGTKGETTMGTVATTLLGKPLKSDLIS